jgi:hypothetical protein
MRNRPVWFVHTWEAHGTRLFAFALLTLVLSPCVAQEASPTPSPTEMEAERIVVTATRLDVPLDESPATYSVSDTGNPNTIFDPRPIDHFLTERWLIGPHIDWRPTDWWDHKFIFSYDHERQVNDPNQDGLSDRRVLSLNGRKLIIKMIWVQPRGSR